MRKKIPLDAFEYYFALGAGRSYRAVAEHFGVSKTAVANAAEREGWQRRVEEREQKARDAAEKESEETLEEMRRDHLKLLRLMRLKAIEVLQRMPLERSIDGIKTLELVIRQERLIRGEPSERAELTIADTIRREYERWMTVVEDDEPTDDDEVGDAADDHQPMSG